MVLVATAGAGCGSWTDQVIQQAAVEHGCPRSNIHLIRQGDHVARLLVCNETRVYRQVGRRRWVEQASTEANSSEPWSDQGVLRWVELVNDPAMRCTGDRPLVLRLVLDESGHARDVRGLDSLAPEPRECVRRLISRARLTGRHGPRQVAIRLAPGEVRLPEPEETPPEPAPAETVGPAATDFDATVRAALDRHGAAVLTCVGAETAAVRFRYEPGAAVQLDVRDVDDPAITQCVRAAVGPLSAPADAAASEGVHALAR